MHRYPFILGFLLFVLVLPAVSAAPKADLWDYWLTHDEQSKQTLDHSAWDRFLQTYVTAGSDGVNRVAYGKVTSADRQALSDYIQMLRKTPVSRLNRAEQQALWINLYNALTIRVILEHYPVKSIRDIDISPGLFADGPWGKKLLKIDGEEVSLDDIEHRILRPIWKDPRIHYAVNCASIGCPNLQRQAFTAANTDSLLNKGAHEYVNHPRGVLIDNGKLTVSSIYEWFQADFGGSDSGVIEHLKRYADADLKNRLQQFDRISDDRYDWTLNAS